MPEAVGAEAAGAEAGAPGFGVYVHWPFCLSKCPYCDFNSHVRERVDQADWRQGLLREIDHYAALTPGRTVTSVFFGGGTPSLMDPATAAAVLERIAARWTLAPGAEVTLEANPTSTEAQSLAGFRAAGVNRLSLGIQALDDRALRFLGRGHDVAEACAAVELAARSFDRFSFDLIYARPEQTVAAWRDELRRALAMAVGHLSVYQLTIEEGTQFHALHRRGAFAMPDDDLAGALYEATQEELEAAGLPAYEISNHARPGEEGRHNLTYWRYGDYVGIGPGAHGRLTLDGTKWATRAHRAPEVWLERTARGGHGAHPHEPVPAEARATELLMMGLRLAEGVPLARISEEAGTPLAELVEPAALDRLVAGGFLEITPARLRATLAGRQRLNAVLAALLP
ncbi:radical SAM family heme chaperone HemW [Arenibaculum pallidiluteum]|uniref:radical SAM family heme chaperone HemW n=1 Tax=Arenibaculum pallidiluteum TaxID=2812559 RepID=UPI001A9696D2|nr:radical SAM family heme chaperone HemW [Arenibaculum pallidiluteum]